MNLHIQTLASGAWRENCHLIWNQQRELLIFDPGADEEVLIAFIESHHLQPLAILNTHGHYDHVGAVAPLQDRFQIPFYMHEGDSKLLRQANLYRHIFGGDRAIRIPSIDIKLTEHTRLLELGPFVVEPLSTPGHTPGSICFRVADHLITGDTLLRGALGRADLPGGHTQDLQNSIERLFAINGNLKIHPGHGADTDLDTERRFCRDKVETLQ